MMDQVVTINSTIILILKTILDCYLAILSRRDQLEKFLGFLNCPQASALKKNGLEASCEALQCR